MGNKLKDVGRSKGNFILPVLLILTAFVALVVFRRSRVEVEAYLYLGAGLALLAGFYLLVKTAPENKYTIYEKGVYLRSQEGEDFIPFNEMKDLVLNYNPSSISFRTQDSSWIIIDSSSENCMKVFTSAYLNSVYPSYKQAFEDGQTLAFNHYRQEDIKRHRLVGALGQKELLNFLNKLDKTLYINKQEIRINGQAYNIEDLVDIRTNTFGGRLSLVDSQGKTILSFYPDAVSQGLILEDLLRSIV